MISDTLANEILDKIEDSDTRARYAAILNGRVTRNVHCLDCDMVIATMWNEARSDGTTGLHVQEAPCVYVNDTPVQGLAGYRVRLDGSVGFQCWCGNDERLLSEEQGILGVAPPSADDIKIITARIAQRTGPYPDKFVIEDAA